MALLANACAPPPPPPHEQILYESLLIHIVRILVIFIYYNDLLTLRNSLIDTVMTFVF